MASGDRFGSSLELGKTAGPLGAIYAAMAQTRRRRSLRPGARRRLRRPVVSIGNLVVGGRGKTPVVAHVAELLREAGEYPAILSRGYGRESVEDGVVVVRDAARICADVARAGDEPLMLARKLPGCAVLASTDRHLAGVLAESRLGCTVHLLDDGFQHVILARNVDLLLLNPTDLHESHVLPAGRLREDARAARLADAWLVPEAEVEMCRSDALRPGLLPVFGVSRTLGRPVLIGGAAFREVSPPAPVLLLSGIADPGRFEADVRDAGYDVRGHVIFADHHRYDVRGLHDLAAQVTASGAVVALTTEKDAVRLLPLRPLPFACACVPLVAFVEPAEEFRSWLLGALETARRRTTAMGRTDP